MNYPIDTDIPPPERENRSAVNYGAVDELKPGQSLLIPSKDFGDLSVHAVASNVRQRAARKGMKVRTEVRVPLLHGEGPGLRVWRDE